MKINKCLMIKFLFLGLGLLQLSFVNVCHAEQETVAVVDMQKVLDQSNIGKESREKIQAELKSSQAKVSAQQAEISKLKADIQKQASVLSEDAMNQKMEQLDKKARDYQRSISDLKESYALKNSTSINKIIEQVREVIDQITKEKKITLVFEKDERVVVYNNPNVDITEEVINSLNR